jgi:PKD repeat protein
MSTRKLLVLALVILLALFPTAAFADDELVISVSTTVNCDQVDFSISVLEGSTPYAKVKLNFGDGETYEVYGLGAIPDPISHTYPAHGTYAWELEIEDANGKTGEVTGKLSLDGPVFSLESEPDPPLLTLMEGTASVLFTAVVEGEPASYSYAWTMDGEPAGDGSTAQMTYTEGGEYTAEVTVTDACGFVESASMTVVVLDPEEDSEKACHPTALKIANAVSELVPTEQAEKTYTCEDILAIFLGEDGGPHVGFGRLWHAYQLTQVIEELTWEQIRDWQLIGGFGWGSLLQLDRFAETLEEMDVGDLMERVLTGETSIGDIRSAVRVVMRHDAEFEEVITRLSEGANQGDLNQFYRLVEDLEVDPEKLDELLESGLEVNDLRHVAKLAERLDADWEAVADAASGNYSWGEINQAYRLASDGVTAEEILEAGVKKYRDEQKVQSQSETQQRQAERLAERYEGADAAELMSLYNGECQGNWGCVRKHLKNQTQTETQTEAYSEQDQRKAAQIASKYGVSEEQVMAKYKECSGNWGCVQAFYRGDTGKGKNK